MNKTHKINSEIHELPVTCDCKLVLIFRYLPLQLRRLKVKAEVTKKYCYLGSFSVLKWYFTTLFKTFMHISHLIYDILSNINAHSIRHVYL